MPNMMDYQQEQHMNWKLTFLVIIGVLFICFVVFGILSYNRGLEKHALETNTEISREVLGQIIQEVKDATYFIAEHPMIQEWQVSPTLVDDHDILIVLNTIKYMLDASNVYIMDTNGNVMVCTPPRDKVFTGQNLNFRPYFQEAIKGQESVYPALSVINKERGLYFSSPICLIGNSKPVGVAVITLALDRFDKGLRNYSNGAIAGLISPEGIIFSSTEKSWLFKSAKPLTVKEREHIRATRQFADKPLEPLGLYLSELRVKYNDESYMLVKDDIAIPGWQVFALSKTTNLHPVPPFIMAGILLIIFVILYIILSIVYGKEKKQQKEKK
ncbi:MAG: cache domain-containing protein [Candidatus Celaenobacter polaris]|nr:cache domain-containing protein [Candidatus Celaenobacter polaris]